MLTIGDGPGLLLISVRGSTTMGERCLKKRSMSAPPAVAPPNACEGSIESDLESNSSNELLTITHLEKLLHVVDIFSRSGIQQATTKLFIG